MKHASIIIAGLLLAGSARADVYYQGKVYKTTADRIITDRQLACSYGPWESETLPNGSTVLTRSKVCVSPEGK